MFKRYKNLIATSIVLPLIAILLSTTLLLGLHTEAVFAKDKTTSKQVINGELVCPKGYIELSIAIDNGAQCIQKNASNIENNSIFIWLRSIIRFLSAGVGLVVVLMIVIGGIQYIGSSGNPQATAAARGRITGAILALLLYIFMFAILNFLVPGGLLG